MASAATTVVTRAGAGSVFPRGLTRAPRSRWDRLLETWARHPDRVDLVWAGIHALVLTILTVHLSADRVSAPQVGVLACCTVLLTALLALRSRFPLPVLGVVLVVQALATAVGTGSPIQLSACVALWTLVASEPPRLVAPAVGASMAVSATDAARVLDRGDLTVVVNIVLSGWLMILLVVVLAAFLRSRREELARQDADLRAAVAHFEEQIERRHLRERVMVADDLHDSIGHSLTAVVALASGGARSLPDHPDEALEALGLIESTARDCLRRTRQVVDRLHGPGSPRQRRSLEEVPDLLDGARTAGLSVDVTEIGPRCEAPEVQDVCFHVVQEGLTNILRHARGARLARVRLVHADGTTMVEVDDDGETTTDGVVGRGLKGLTLRARRAGGSLEAGPVQPRGWRVRAVMPWPGAV